MSTEGTVAGQPQPRWNPTNYDQKAGFVSEMAGDDLLALLAARPGERILDVGCGTGTLAARLVASGVTVEGVDLSADMIASARAAVPGARFWVRDAQRLWESPADDSQSLCPGSFDGVLSNAALHWMPDLRAAADGMARALRPGGRLVAELGGAGCVATIRRALAETLRAHGVDGRQTEPWVFPDIATYAGVLVSVGLRPTLMRHFDRPTRIADADGLRDWLRTFAAQMFDQLPSGETEMALSEVEARCRPHLWRGEAWVLDYVRLRVVAERAVAEDGDAGRGDLPASVPAPGEADENGRRRGRR